MQRKNRRPARPVIKRREVLVEGIYDYANQAVVEAVNVQNGNQCEDWAMIEAPVHFDNKPVRLVLEIRAK